MDSSMCDIFVVSLLAEDIEKNKRKKLKRKRQWLDPLWVNRNLVEEYATLIPQLKQNNTKFKENHTHNDYVIINQIYPGAMQIATCRQGVENHTCAALFRPIQRRTRRNSAECGRSALISI
ncbi:hypothetical protein B5X24_HaOG215197 [Helicoverpa armigera]|nr:hypothetical protein B5X24_HaOG215197 [Helicoverpa armigera]